ncbi:hypothetical protein JXL21_13995 [Candidatus Bathyarchaeota archaeon]|nr:hypothetical protein [Candidatus Bathyarchaeota archaeon]
MKITRDVVVIVAVLTLLVSSTAAYVLNPVRESRSRDIVEVQDTPFIIIDRDYTFPFFPFNTVDFTLTLSHAEPEEQSATVEIQALNSTGDIIYYEDIPLMQEADTGSLDPDQQWSHTFRFYKPGIKGEVTSFLIFINGNQLEGTFTSDVGSQGTSGALTVYRSSDALGSDYPKYRLFDESWGTQGELDEAHGAPMYVRSAYSPLISNFGEAVTVTLDSRGVLDAYVYDGEGWTHDVFGQLWQGNNNKNYRPYDVAYEQTSGGAMLLYAVRNNDNPGNKDLAYRVYQQGSWSEEMYVDLPGTHQVRYVKLASNPRSGSDEVSALFINNQKRAGVIIWDGDSWSEVHMVTDTSSQANYAEYECGDVAYEYTSGRLHAVVGSHGNALRSTNANGTWTDEDPLTLVTRGSKDVRWLMLRPHRLQGSNRIMLIAVNSDSRVYSNTYTTWFGFYDWWEPIPWEIDGDGLDSRATRCIDGDWHPDGLQFWLFANDDDSPYLNYKVYKLAPIGIGYWSPIGGWDQYTGQVMNHLRWVNVRAIPYYGQPSLLVTTLDMNGNLNAVGVNGEDDVSVTELSADVDETGYECYDVAWMRYPPA